MQFIVGNYSGEGVEKCEVYWWIDRQLDIYVYNDYGWSKKHTVAFSSVELKSFTMIEWYQNDRSNNFFKELYTCKHTLRK